MVIANLYYNIGEYTTALDYVQGYISVDDKSAKAYKVLGQCYEKLKRPDKQLHAYQSSLELDKKQSDLLIEVCKLMQNSELSDVTPGKANYWYKLAESRGIHDSAVLNLKLKFNNDTDGISVKEIILKEIVRRPSDVALRIRLIYHYIEQNQATEAFAHVYDVEIKSVSHFRNSIDWYAAVSEVLDKYKEKHGSGLHRNWSYWLLLIWTLERRLHLTLKQTSKDNQKNDENMLAATILLRELDNQLNKAATECTFPEPDRDLASECLAHYRGQLCLHMASILFKREINNGVRSNWPETTKMSLPLLMLAYNCATMDSNQPWLKRASEVSKNLVDRWHISNCFRRVQAARTLQSCLSPHELNDNVALANLRRICTDKYASWCTVDDLFNEIRSFVADSQWRKKVHRAIFGNKQYDSHFLRSQALETPTYEWPDMNTLKQYEEKAQNDDPSSLQHMVYVTIGSEQLKRSPITVDPDFRCNVFDKMHFSVNILTNCNLETLNKLDVESFLYAAAIQAKRSLSTENTLVAASDAEVNRPKLLPFVLIADNLCSQNQADWWNAAWVVSRHKNTRLFRWIFFTKLYSLHIHTGSQQSVG